MIKRIVLFVILIFVLWYGVSKIKQYQPDVDTRKKFTFWSIQLKPIYEKQMNNIISEFEEKYPEYKVVWVDIPIQEAQKRTLASILSSTPPDLINLNPEFSHILAKKNALEFLNPIKMNRFHEGLVNKLKYKEHVYGIPFYATSPVAVYNKEILNKCLNGQVIKTYNDLILNSQKLYACSKEPVYVANLNENDTLLKILNKYDIQDFSSDEVVDAAKLYNALNYMYKAGYMPKDTLTINHREVIEKYMSNQASVIVAGTNFIKMIKENAPDVYKKTAISEQLVGSNKKYDVSLMNLVIPKKAKNKELAYEFASILTSEENQLELAKQTNVLPANIFALRNNYFKNCSSDIVDKSRCVSVKQLDNLIINNVEIKDKKALNEALNKELERILLDKNSDFKLIKIGINNLFPLLNSFIE
ncbi:MAG: extracellular solute-binding protein [Candidatus Gastranaerophilales bacterium]|nr:extracellular solute-binding protein [Candidatus Gastranaerophilales bacterium]